jgi:hypothetical protein
MREAHQAFQVAPYSHGSRRRRGAVYQMGFWATMVGRLICFGAFYVALWLLLKFTATRLKTAIVMVVTAVATSLKKRRLG